MLLENPIIAAVRKTEDFQAALSSQLRVIFLLNANILTLQEDIQAVKKHGKKLFVHLDMAEGVGKDQYGVAYLAKMGVDGIISTRGNIIKLAKEFGLTTVQRFFIIDFHSMHNVLDTVKSLKPDMIEVMPGIIPKIIARFCESIHIPIITGGLIETKQEVIEALSAGATAISTSNKQIWLNL